MAATRYLLIWLSPKLIDPKRVIPIRRAIEDSVKEPPEDVEIDVWLESPGGDAHSAFKLALMLGTLRATFASWSPTLRRAPRRFWRSPGTRFI